MKRLYVPFFLLVVTLVQLTSSGASAQTDPKNRSRLEIRPKPAASSKPETLSVLKSAKTQDINPKRTLSINQYYRNQQLVKSRPAPAPKTTPSEPVAQPSSVSVERGSDEASAAADKLYHTDRLSVSNLYPNPAVSEYTYVDYNVGAGVNQVKLSFFNLLGSPVGEFALDRTERRMKISTADWPNGMYFYQLSHDGKTVATKKLLVRHQ